MDLALQGESSAPPPPKLPPAPLISFATGLPECSISSLKIKLHPQCRAGAEAGNKPQPGPALPAPALLLGLSGFVCG